MSTAKRHKKNLIVSYKNLPDDAKVLFKERYPDGYSDHIQRFVKPTGESIFVVPLDTDDTAYMVKFDMVIDTMGEDLDKALFDDDGDSGNKEGEFAPLSEAMEKEDNDNSHTERVLRHGDFETNLEEDEKRRQKLAVDIDKDELLAALDGDDGELDSYDDGDEDVDVDDDFEPTDDDLRGIEAEYLDAEIPPLDAEIPLLDAEPDVASTSSSASGTKKKTASKKTTTIKRKKSNIKK